MENNPLPISTSKLPGETEQQYTAWLLYHETGSIEKLWKTWKDFDYLSINLRSKFEPLQERLGSRPRVMTTLANWSRKFQWVARSDLKRKEFLEEMKKQLEQIDEDRIYFVAQLFKRIADKKLKQLANGESVTTGDFKQSWEMLRVERGLTTSKGEQVNKNQNMIREEDQRPLSPEEEILSKKIGELCESFYEGKYKEEAEEMMKLRSQRQPLDPDDQEGQ